MFYLINFVIMVVCLLVSIAFLSFGFVITGSVFGVAFLLEVWYFYSKYCAIMEQVENVKSLKKLFGLAKKML